MLIQHSAYLEVRNFQSDLLVIPLLITASPTKACTKRALVLVRFNATQLLQLQLLGGILTHLP